MKSSISISVGAEERDGSDWMYRHKWDEASRQEWLRDGVASFLPIFEDTIDIPHEEVIEEPKQLPQ